MERFPLLHMNGDYGMGNRRGLFVVFEGIDGSGKSTQIGRLSDYVRAQDKYQDVLLTREPTWRATELKDKLKGDSDAFSDARLMARLFVEDRKIHAYSQILPVLKERCFVICDRYTMSTLAYQSAQGEDMRALIQLHRDAKITAPDLTFYVNVSNATAAKRRIARGESAEKFEKDASFMQKLHETYDGIIQSLGYNDELTALLGDVRVINGEQEKEKVFEEIRIRFDEVYSTWKDSRNL